MITKELAMSLRHGAELWHSTYRNADGTPTRARVNGMCKTWKTHPNDFELPVKYGLKQCFYITPKSAYCWSLPARHPIEKSYTF